MIKYLLVFVLVCTTLACDIVVNSEPLVDSEPQLLK